jgi:putative glutamine amidotransferase
VVLIAVTASSSEEAERYAASIWRRGGSVRVLTADLGQSVEEALEGVGGLLLAGGADVDPGRYGQEPDPSAHIRTDLPRDEMEFALLGAALDRDLPVLGICRGMQVLNVAFGGSLLQDILGHRLPAGEEGEAPSAFHPVYVSPGSKLGAIIGLGAIYRTNSRHHQGIREAQKPAALLASAYAPGDGIIEGVESLAHTWVIGVQCDLEREDEVPKSFLHLFDGLLEWAGSIKGVV